MDTLKRVYKKTKDHNNQNGNEKKSCNYYEELDELFAKKPWVKPLSVAGSNMPLPNFDINELSVATSKRPRSRLQDEKIACMQFIEEKRLRRQNTEEYRRKKLSIMEDLVNTSKKNNIINDCVSVHASSDLNKCHASM